MQKWELEGKTGRMEMAEQENSGELRLWDELIPDALGLIFGNLALQEILTVVPRVCKSWARAVAGPYCWQEIDIDEWSARSAPDRIDRMLRLLLSRSSGSLRKLSVSNLSSDLIFSFLAQHAGSLQTLRVPRSEMSDAIMEQVAGSFSGIRFLDLSYCLKMGPRALEAVGRNCKLLVGLCRNMHPLDTAGKPTEDDEAHAIAATMPGLRHLEMAYHLASTASVLRILSSCPDLEFLDVRGCWSVDLDPKFVEERVPKIKILGPVVVDHYGRHDWDYEDCSDFSDASSEYLAWEFMGGEMGGFYDDDDDVDGEIFDGMWDDEAGLDGLELRFYEGVDRDADGWPPSP